MTKQEIIDILVDKYDFENKGLMRNSLKDLEDILKKIEEEKKLEEVSEVAEEIVEEETAEEIVEKKMVNEKDISLEKADMEEIKGGFLEGVCMEGGFQVEGVASEIQLKIFETVVRRYDPPRNLMIENLGMGDIFVNESKENLICEDNKIEPGQGHGITDVGVLYITSASRPIVRIVY